MRAEPRGKRFKRDDMTTELLLLIIGFLLGIMTMAVLQLIVRDE